MLDKDLLSLLSVAQLMDPDTIDADLDVATDDGRRRDDGIGVNPGPCPEMLELHEDLPVVSPAYRAVDLRALGWGVVSRREARIEAPPESPRHPRGIRNRPAIRGNVRRRGGSAPPAPARKLHP